MPPPRRRPTTPPARRPRVAGLRKPATPAGQPEVEPAERTEVIERVEAEPRPARPRPAPAARPADPADPEETGHAGTLSGSVIGVPDQDEPAFDDLVDTDTDDTADAEETGAADPADEEVEEPKAARRPAGKRRTTGSAAPSDLDAAEKTTGGDPDGGPASGRTRPRGLDLAIGLAVVALVLAGLAFWFKGNADSLNGGADAGNRALVDSAATSEVVGKLTVAVERTLSYNFADLDATAKAVQQNLTGKASCEYDALFGQVRQLAPEQKLVLTTKVRDLGVASLEGDRATLVVFVDQTTTRTDQNQTTASGAQFGIRAARQDGTWKITEIDMLSQPLPNGQPAPAC